MHLSTCLFQGVCPLRGSGFPAGLGPLLLFVVLHSSPEEPRQRLVRRLAALEGDFVSVGGGRMERLQKGSCWVEADAGVQATGGDSRVSWGAVPLALVEGR